MAVGFIDEVRFGDWNSRRGEEVKKDWIRFFEDDPWHRENYISECSSSHHFFKETIKTLKQRLNQTDGMDLFHLLLLKCLLSLLVLK